ncbi:class I adenylate-forming enzyme family protein [Amycolatopsis sp. 195334CR]|uniref:class I adenylate-forming enzyme family protein n=1 Tax=Amycolatopsis sp. 195334CR TaxID=2814588 RepID=UPI001A8FF892|nr:AMP-binding protein [Amycolatopsis sp. 195334CR]MBN6042103.1 AMP-binding protein [Amycolatopsis sp. 195334CR]
MLTVPALLADTARRFPDRPFLVVATDSGREETTYAQAWRRAGELAAALSARGVLPGSRVVAVLPNQPELVHLFFAVPSIGATLVPLDPRLTDLELTSLIAHADPALVILPLGRALDTGRPTVHIGHLTAENEVAPQEDPAVPAVVLYTSGSTGRPKGCLLPHASFLTPAGHMAGRLRLTEEDVLLHVLPLHHMAGLSFLTTAVAVGAAVALVPRFSGSRFWAQAEATGATVFRHLGEMLAVLCAHRKSAVERRHRLRLAYGAGATPAVAAHFTGRFGVPTLEGYGMSETNTVLCGTSGESMPGTLGKPLPHIRFRIMGPHGEVHGRGVGELQVGPNPAMFGGYLGAPELTAAAFDDGWYRTGDLIARGADGELRFVRRITDSIRRRGENIDPAEIEQVAESFPGVRRAAAVGVPAEVGGVDIMLYLEPVPGHSVSAAAVLTLCIERLATFKLPRYLELVDRLPLTATQKIDKVALRRFSAARFGEVAR